ncbi:hypothetical protein OIU78_021852 [Salix suchowensis]|nr:hypothetical protein OIU78_021852 [Salix suchowensis]
MVTCRAIQTGATGTHPEPHSFASSLYLHTLFLPAKKWKRRNHSSERMQERQIEEALLFLELPGDSKSKKNRQTNPSTECCHSCIPSPI